MIDLLFMFCIYSILGWIIEVIYFLIKTGHFQKRGILHGAYCPLYGVSLVVCTVVTSNIINNFAISFLVCAVICTVFEFITGLIFDKILGNIMWDYSGYKYNLCGYICLPFSIIWGVLALFSIKIFNPILLSVNVSIKLIASCSVVIFMILDIISFTKYKKTHHN